MRSFLSMPRFLLEKQTETTTTSSLRVKRIFICETVGPALLEQRDDNRWIVAYLLLLFAVRGHETHARLFATHHRRWSIFIDRRSIVMFHLSFSQGKMAEGNARFSAIDFMTEATECQLERISKGSGHEAIEKEIHRIVDQGQDVECIT